MEESYESFAGVYDLFMDNIDYPAWCTYLTGILKEYGIEDGLIAELGCGTGSMTELLAAEGYDMIGIDNSPGYAGGRPGKTGGIRSGYFISDAGYAGI